MGQRMDKYEQVGFGSFLEQKSGRTTYQHTETSEEDGGGDEKNLFLMSNESLMPSRVGLMVNGSSKRAQSHGRDKTKAPVPKKGSRGE